MGNLLAVHVANSWWMYLLGVFVVIFVLVGSLFFIFRSYQDAKKLNMDRKILKKTIINSFKNGAANIANLSGICFASVLGVISPKIKTIIVITAVETVGPDLSSIQPINKIVASDALKILTILLPIKIVDNIVSYFSSIFNTNLADLFPLSAKFLILILLNVENAVSAAEK